MEYKLFKILNTKKEYRAGYFWKADLEEKGVVVICHGMAEHSARYDDFAKFLNKSGYSVISLDHEEHGLNVEKGPGVWDKGTFDDCVSNLRTVILNLKFLGKPIYLLGHSMGSYMAQYYLEKYGDDPIVDRVVLSGTSGPRGAFKLGKLVCKLISKFKKQNKVSKFVDSMAFGSFNSRIKKSDRITPHAWLSHDKDVLKNYEEDPLCGFIPSLGFYCSFFNYLTILHSKKMRTETSKNVSILIIGGDEDPVTVYSKGMKKLHAIYSNLGIKTELKILKGFRHEILNEIGKEEVYNYILGFIK